MSEKDLLNLEAISIKIRRDVLHMVAKAGSGHIPSALSIVELLVVLYYKILNINPKYPNAKNRDRFVLSKGHGCASLYIVLAGLGFFPKSELDKFESMKGILGGHPEMHTTPGVEVSTGSLGQGFPMALGFAMSAKLNNADHKVYTIVGDGECNEGSVWEAAAIGAHFNLDNLITIVDLNKQQSSGSVFEVQNPHDMADKWRAFGWYVVEINGHDIRQIHEVLCDIPKRKNKPTAIIAHTIKGKGISFMEDDRKWHTMIPSDEEYSQAMIEFLEQEKKVEERIGK